MPEEEAEALALKWINYLCLQLKQGDENGGQGPEEEQGVFDQAMRMQRDYDSMWKSSKEAVRKGAIEGFGKKTEEVTRGGIGIYHYLNPEAQDEIER
jgi:hypothetical protein